MDLVERLAPQPRLGVDLDQQHRQRPAGVLGRRIERFELARAEIRIDLQHAAAGPAHALGQREQLDLARTERGREAAVARLVLGGARGRDAERAGAQRLGDQPGHLLALALVRHLGVVGAALAHDVEAQRAVRQLGADVDGARHGAERVEVLRKALPVHVRPSASAVPGMSSTPSIKPINH